jgi:hypothetical protein
MPKQRKLVIGLGALGFMITTALFAYLEFTNYSPLNPILLCTSVFLCPPSLSSILFIDAEPHTSGIVVVWSVIGLMNAALYAAIGAGIVRYLKKVGRTP